jgi:hypothetical protein
VDKGRRNRNQSALLSRKPSTEVPVLCLDKQTAERIRFDGEKKRKRKSQPSPQTSQSQTNAARRTPSHPASTSAGCRSAHTAHGTASTHATQRCAAQRHPPIHPSIRPSPAKQYTTVSYNTVIIADLTSPPPKASAKAGQTPQQRHHSHALAPSPRPNKAKARVKCSAKVARRNASGRVAMAELSRPKR